jgi:hypothetical protein
LFLSFVSFLYLTVYYYATLFLSVHNFISNRSRRCALVFPKRNDLSKHCFVSCRCRQALIWIKDLYTCSVIGYINPCLNGVLIDVPVICISWNGVDVSFFYQLGQKFAFLYVSKALVNYFFMTQRFYTYKLSPLAWRFNLKSARLNLSWMYSCNRSQVFINTTKGDIVGSILQGIVQGMNNLLFHPRVSGKTWLARMPRRSTWRILNFPI